MFSKLPGLTFGSPIIVVDRSGGIHRYRLVLTRQVPKAQFPAGSVYRPSRKPTLVLVTCGGDYEPGHGYKDNVLLYAEA